MVNNEILKSYAFVARSPNRRKVLQELSKSPQIPSDLSKKLNLNINHVSRALAELRRNDLVRCVNPEDKKGRVYELSEKGKEVCQRFRYS